MLPNSDFGHDLEVQSGGGVKVTPPLTALFQKAKIGIIHVTGRLGWFYRYALM